MREFEQRMNGLKPYYWQLDVAEALILGLDAGTGAGKSMPFVMPLFAFPDKMVIILSPLNALEEHQAVRFSGIGLKAVAVNGDTYSKDIHKKFKKRHYNVIITSPEMCLEHVQFRSLLNLNAFAKNILVLVIDEAHCISQWGDKFRKSYADLGTLRAFVPAKVPILATSATLPPVILAQVQKTLLMDSESIFHVNQGTDRPNITWFVRRMTAAKSDLESLSFLISLDEDGNVISFRQTLIFFDDIKVSRVWSVDERSYLCILMMECPVKVSLCLKGLSWLSSIPEPTGDCCDNCLRRLGTTHDLMQFPLANEVKEVKDEPIDAVTSFVGASTSRKRSATGIIKLEGSETSLNGPKTRRDQFRQGAIQLLESWRLQTYEAHYLRRPWGPHCLLPDNILSSLASKRTITTVQDLIGEGWSATHAQKHGLDVLKCLADYDLGHFKDLEEKREEKKRETEERRALEAQEAKRRRAEAKAIRQAQPKPPRPSRAKSQQNTNVLGNSAVLNMPSFSHLAVTTPSVSLPAVASSAPPGHGLMSASSLQPGLMPPPVLAGLMPSPVIPQSQSAFPGLMHSPVISQPLVQGLPGHYYYQPGHYHYYQQPGSQPYHLQPQALYHQQYHYIPHYSQPQNQPQNQSHLPGDWGQNPN
ncbi:hypothetical protein F5887DRAFT_1076461 [Amanita rubescens]|nr:hypothetical protein F5887DRAFT_1076461 [Amanita rubescens]